MREINIEVRSDNDQPVEAQIRVETQIGATGEWRVESSTDVVSGEREAKRVIGLLDGDRLVIEAKGYQTEMVFDKDQNAAMPRHALESQPSPEERQKMEADRQKELESGSRAQRKLDIGAGRAAEQARDKVIAEQQEKSREAAAASNEKQNTQNPGSDAANKSPSPATGTSTGSPQSPAASRQSPPTGAAKNDAPSGAGAGGMTAPGPSTAGQSSKDVKNNG